MWRGIAKYNNLTAQQLGSTEMVTLSRFICGLNTNEIKQLNKEAFKLVQHTNLKCGSIQTTFFQLVLLVI